jgi:cytidylate kinase
MPRRLPDTIAIDGPAASGKTTVGMAIAEKYGYLFLDTGLMYRAVTLAALRSNIPATSEAARKLLMYLSLSVQVTRDGTRVLLGAEDVTVHLRDADVEARVSDYAAIPEVREAMVRQQRAIAAKGNAVLAGRDIGTVVLPNAPLKLYFHASEDARAERRGSQAIQAAEAARRDIANRDKKDSGREVSPLKPAADAIVIDTTNMALEDVVKLALEKVSCASV